MTPRVDHRLLGDPEQLAGHLGREHSPGRCPAACPRRSAASRPGRTSRWRPRASPPRSRADRGPPSRRAAPRCSAPSIAGVGEQLARRPSGFAARAPSPAWTASCPGRSAPAPGRRGSTPPRGGAPRPRSRIVWRESSRARSREAVSAVRSRPTTRPVEIAASTNSVSWKATMWGRATAPAQRGAGHQHDGPDDGEHHPAAAHPGSGRGRRSGRWRRSCTPERPPRESTSSTASERPARSPHRRSGPRRLPGGAARARARPATRARPRPPITRAVFSQPS